MGKILVILAFTVFTLTMKHKYYRIVKLLPDLVLVDNYDDRDTIVISNFEGIYYRDKTMANWCIGCAVTIMHETDSTREIKVNGNKIDSHYTFKKSDWDTRGVASALK